MKFTIKFTINIYNKYLQKIFTIKFTINIYNKIYNEYLQ